MPEYRETVDDIARKYQGTYIQLKGSTEVVFAAEIDGAAGDEEADRIMVQTIRANQKRDVVEITQDSDISPIISDSKFFNVFSSTKVRKDISLLFRRRLRRQWKKSLCSETGVLQNSFSDLCLAAKHVWYDSYSLTFNFENVTALLNPQYPSWTECVANLYSGKWGSVAFHPHFSLCWSSLSPDKLLIESLGGFIGETDGSVLYVHHPVVLQEVTDMAKRLNLPLKICRM